MNLNSAGQSPDSNSNYLLRSTPVYVIGQNAQNMITADNPTIGGVGGINVSYYEPYQPVTKTDQWNITIEREVARNTLFRFSLLGNHAFDLDQIYDYNEQVNNYVWFLNTGQSLPTGSMSAVARRAYPNSPYGMLELMVKTGWANTTGFQTGIERRFSRGIAYQLFYVMNHAYRAGGNDWRDDAMQDPYMFIRGSVPDDYHARNKLLNYHLDSDIPKHRIRWNWLVDMPFGRGKLLGRNAGGVLNRVIGGWQLAGMGNFTSRWWQYPTDYWGGLNKPTVYGKKYPIQDCRSGECQRGYLWLNGYIPANRINSYDPKTGKPNGVMGVPSNYTPAYYPLIPIAADGSNVNDQYVGTNTVFIRLNNGSTQAVAIDPNMHPWQNQYMLGPFNWNLDASLFKQIPITERMRVRFNADFFNVLNRPGTPMPGQAGGVLTFANSVNAPRTLQLTLRLLW